MRSAAKMPFCLALQTRSKKTVVTVIFGVAWAVALAVSAGVLLNYENAPGRVGNVPASWPVASQIKRSSERPTLVMLVHPYCPCSRASIGELARLMARVPGKISAYVLFFKPKDRWANSDLQRSAAAIPGVIILTDLNGIEAGRFGGETSGHTLLFDRSGRLLFSGGITSSRGHSGDNAGERAIISLVNNEPPGRIATLVFGCSLTDPGVRTGR
jgi:hypothetical protein